MPHVADRVKETSTTTGTGNLTLAGAVSGFQTFNAAFGTNRPFSYYIIDANGTAWEQGFGYLSASTTLVRSQVNKSTNSNAAISLSAGTHSVFCSITDDQFDDLTGKCLAMARGAAMP